MTNESQIKTVRTPPKVILIYGRGGCGKTTAIAECARKAEFGDLYFVNMDMDGIDSVYDKDHNLRPGIHHSAMIRNVDELKKEWTKLERRSGIAPEVRTVVFDSFSIIDLRVINHVSDGGDPCDIGQMNQQKWGHRAQMINNHITSAFDLPYDNVIFTAHERIERNDKGQITHRSPSVGSEKSKAIGEGALSCIIHMEMMSKTRRVLTCGYHPVTVAKCRSQAVMAMLDEQGTTTKPLHEVLACL